MKGLLFMFKNIRRSYSMVIGIFILTFVLMLPFQNCAKSPNVMFEDSKVAETLNFFEYRYTKMTPIYFEIQIVPTSADATNQSYDLLGLAAASDASLVDIEYSIEVFGTDQISICPLKSGVIRAGTSLTTETCSLLKTKKIGYAVMKVRKQSGEWNTYTKSYNN